jgi:hypothetical protein
VTSDELLIGEKDMLDIRNQLFTTSLLQRHTAAIYTENQCFSSPGFNLRIKLFS